MIRNLPANTGDTGQEDPLEKEMATHSSILAWEIPRTEETGRLQSMGVTKESDMTEQLKSLTHKDLEIDKLNCKSTVI